MQSPETIKAVWASGFVNRWHSHPDPRLRNSHDTTAAHSQRVAVLCAALLDVLEDGKDAFVEDAAVIISALVHDAPECYTGDAPYSYKRDGFTNDLDRAEGNWLDQHDLDASIPSPMVKLCDMLDAWLFVKLVAPDLIHTAEWVRHKDEVIKHAQFLGVRWLVERIMNV